MDPFEISIIIINYNTSQLTSNCVESIIKHEHNKSIEFIIIDNASMEEDFQNLVKLTSNVANLKIFRSKINPQTNNNYTNWQCQGLRIGWFELYPCRIVNGSEQQSDYPYGTYLSKNWVFK